MNNKVTFPELVRLVAEATSTTGRMSELFLKELFATVSQALIDGQNVTIKNLGTFELAQTPARQVVNVQDGEQMDVPAHSRLVFTPDKALAEAVNQPFAAFKPIVLSDDMTDEMLQAIDQDMLTAVASQPPATSSEAQPATASEAQPATAAETQPAIAPLMPPPLAQTPEPDTPVDEPASEPEPERETPPEPTAEVTHAAEAMPDNKINQEPEPVMNQEPQATERTVDYYLKSEYEREKREIAHRAFLKGLATGVLATLALAAIIWGAWSSGRNSVLTDLQPAVQADTIAEPAAVRQSHQATTDAAAPPQTTAPRQTTDTPVVTDTCTATMYLSKMSTKHYGKPDFWIYIYEENCDKIADPNNVTPGTVVVVPPEAKYGIDPNDKSSIDRARRRTYELLSGK